MRFKLAEAHQLQKRRNNWHRSSLSKKRIGTLTWCHLKTTISFALLGSCIRGSRTIRWRKIYDASSRAVEEGRLLFWLTYFRHYFLKWCWCNIFILKIWKVQNAIWRRRAGPANNHPVFERGISQSRLYFELFTAQKIFCLCCFTSEK